MRRIFVLGIARSGTTLLARLLASTSTPARFVAELCPGIRDRIRSPLFMVEPGDAAGIAQVREAIELLASGGSPFPREQSHRLERDDPDARALIVKDVHSLLAYPEILAGIPDWRAVVITRDPLRSLDSYFHGHRPEERRYLVEERAWLERALSGGTRDPLLAAALEGVHPGVVRYLRRPRLLTSELLAQAAVAELVRQFLAGWADREERIARVRFEELCGDPRGEMLRLFDFLGLEHDEGSLAAIERMTTGRSREYYATDKDSRAILEQPYKFLQPRHRRRVASLLGRAAGAQRKAS